MSTTKIKKTSRVDISERQLVGLLRGEYRRGVLAAAGQAAEYRTSHPYRLDDVIACKLNVSSRKKPRKNPRVLPDPRHSALQGIALALSGVYLVGHHGSVVREIAAAGGCTQAAMREAGVCQFDRTTLRNAGVR